MTCIGIPTAGARDGGCGSRGPRPRRDPVRKPQLPGRVHPQIEAAFLASPPLTLAYALAGDVNRDILTAPVGHAADGEAVYLSDLWPSGVEIDAAFAAARDATDFRRRLPRRGGTRSGSPSSTGGCGMALGPRIDVPPPSALHTPR